MKNYRRYVILLFALCVSSLVRADTDWEKLSDDDQIQTYRKEMPGTSLVAFRGEALVDAPTARVAQILSDSVLRKEWVSNIVEAKNVRIISPMERVEYNHTGAPWPIKDRDFVFEAKVQLDDAQKEVKIVIRSIVDEAAPETKNVRGNINYGHYLMRPQDGGSKTWVQVEIHADPKGAIPKWVVNLFQKKWPRKTLEGIRRVAARTNIPDHAETANWIAKVYQK